MIIVRILVAIIAIPFWLIAKALQGFFYIATCISAKIFQFLGGAAFLLGLIFLSIRLFGDTGASDGLGAYLALVGGGLAVYCIPYIGAFLSGLFDGIATFIAELAFSRG